MKQKLRYTLIGDGSSDSTLMPIIKWLLDDLFPQLPNEGNFVDFRYMKKAPKKSNVKEQINEAIKQYPCDILCYHRDAEQRTKDIVAQRKSEILQHSPTSLPIVCIVPVVMTEAWLLIDEMAIKKAAGNRNYKGQIALPIPAKLADIADPKDQLHQYLKEASGLKGRKLDKFEIHQAVHQVAENIRDFSPLRQLKAFEIFENDLRIVVGNFIDSQI
jgi:hypothetical protein